MLTRAISLSLALAALSFTGVDALNKKLKDLLASRQNQEDPTDIEDEEWNDKLYGIVSMIPFEEVYIGEDAFHEGDEDRPIEEDVMYLTMDRYKEIFFGPEPPKQPWLIALVDNVDNEWIGQSAMLYSVLRVMAADRKDVRFGIFYDKSKDGPLFSVMTDTYVLPNYFLFYPNEETGVWEMQESNGLMYQYTAINWWIDNKDGVMRKRLSYRDPRPVPAPFSNDISLSIWNWRRKFHRWYIYEGQNYFTEFMQHNYYDGKSLKKYFEMEEHFYLWPAVDQSMFWIKIIFALAVVGILYLCCCVYCCYRCCCASKKSQKPASVAPSAASAGKSDAKTKKPTREKIE